MSDRPYDAEELEMYAAQQRCTVEDFAKRWIIQNGDAFWIYGNGQYQSPIRKCELLASLKRDLAPAPIEWVTYEGTNGKPRKKKIDELIEEYSTLARHLVADMTIDDSFYDERTQTFHEAICPRRNIAPKEHLEVAEWLQAFAGPSHDKVLDWIATITRLDRPTAAIVLKGPPGPGKNMFAAGLSRIWSEENPVSLAAAIASFNDACTRSPLIFADEKLPDTFGRKISSAVLRELIGGIGFEIRRKHKPSATVRGAIRLIIAANSDSILRFDAEDCSSDDTKAIAGRFLYVPVSEAAVAHLEERGGWKHTEQWVSGDKIAAHALWLAQTRHVEVGPRFLVSGDAQALADKLVTRGGVRGNVAEWVVRAVADARQTPGVLVGAGEVLVNPSAVSEHWEMYMVRFRLPSSERIGEALGGISNGKVQRGPRGNRPWYWRVRVELLLDVAERLGLDRENLQQKIGKPRLEAVEDHSAPDNEPAPPRVAPLTPAAEVRS